MQEDFNKFYQEDRDEFDFDEIPSAEEDDSEDQDLED